MLLGRLKSQKPLKNQWFFNDFACAMVSINGPNGVEKPTKIRAAKHILEHAINPFKWSLKNLFEYMLDVLVYSIYYIVYTSYLIL